MKERKIKKHIASVLKIYLLYAVLTAILIPLPQKESSGELWRQYEARLDTPAAQERVMTIEDSDSALLLRLQLIESARRELIFSTFDLRADESGQDVMSALCAAAERGVQVRMIVDGLNGFLHLQGDATLRALAAAENVVTAREIAALSVGDETFSAASVTEVQLYDANQDGLSVDVWFGNDYYPA